MADNYNPDPMPLKSSRSGDRVRHLVTLVIVLALAAAAIAVFVYLSKAGNVDDDAVIEAVPATELPATEAPEVVPEPVEPEPEPEPEPAAPEPVAEIVPAPEPVPAAEPEPEPAEPVAEIVPAAEPGSEIVPAEEPAAESKGGGMPAADAELQKMFQEATDELAAFRYVKARDIVREALKREDFTWDNPLWLPMAAILGKANTTLALTDVRAPEKITHTIVAGDSVGSLAKANHSTVEAIAILNKLDDPGRIMAGYKLAIYPGPWSIKVSLEHKLVCLYNNGQLFKVYSAGIGREARTPTGTFRIGDRVPNPSWTTGNREIPYGDPGNPLGTRWMPLASTGDTPAVEGIGFHGTWDDSTISHAISNGCVRMHNSDIEEMFNLVPVGTPVVIED